MNPTGLAGTDGKITSLAWHDGILYAGGEFSIAGTGFTDNVAQWDGKEWAPLGKGIPGPIGALCCDSKGTLYAAATIRQQGPRARLPRAARYMALSETAVIFKWNGKAWQAIGTANTGTKQAGYVRSLACDSEGRLYASGSFNAIDECKARNIAWWDGNAWQPVGDGKGFPLGNNTYSGDPIYYLLAGKEGKIYTANRNRIGCWDGSAWSYMGEPLEGGLSVLVLDKKGRLVAGGEFRRQNQNSLPLAFFKSGAWEYPEMKFSSRVNALAFDKKGTLHLGSNSTVRTVKKNELIPLGGPEYESRLQGHVQAMVFDDDGNLYTAGYGISIGGRGPNVTILKRNGKQWDRMTPRYDNSAASVPIPPARTVLPKDVILPDSLFLEKIKCFATTPNGHVYLSGDFEVFVGKECLSRLAHWDGSAWHAVGSGLRAPAKVLAADVFGNVYAAGRFPSGRRNSWNTLLQWDGTEWQPIRYVPQEIKTMACDASGYLYIGTAGSPKGGWHKSLCRWDDSTLTVIEGAPSGSFPAFIPTGAITQLDVIGTELHVQGSFTTVGGLISPGYAVYDLGAPDAMRINAIKKAMQSAAGQPDERAATVLLEEAYCNLGTDRVTRFEKMEVSNQTTGALDSVVLHTPDSSGFTYDETEAKWGHITRHPSITATPQGFRFSFPLERPLLPGRSRPLWIRKSLPGRVTAPEPDAWIYEDTLKTLFTNVGIKPGWDKRSLYRLSVVEYDSFTVLSGGTSRDRQYTTVAGAAGTPFYVRFAKTPQSDPLCGAVLEYVDCRNLINEYVPPPDDVLPRLKKLSRIKQALLGRELVDWCFSFGRPWGSGELWDMVGEDPEGTVPAREELMKRFAEISGFYLDALALVAPNVDKETRRLAADKVEEWNPPEYGSEGNPAPVDRLEGDIVYCYVNGEDREPDISFYPMELIRSTLKLLGTDAEDGLKAFEGYFR